MKIIISKVLSPFGLDINQIYGFLDFIVGFILITMPWFYVHDNNLQMLAIVIVSGSALILYSIFTDYRRGIIKYMAQKIHQALDITLGVTFMAIWPLQFTITGVAVSCLGLIVLAGAYFL